MTNMSNKQQQGSHATSNLPPPHTCPLRGNAVCTRAALSTASIRTVLYPQRLAPSPVPRQPTAVTWSAAHPLAVRQNAAACRTATDRSLMETSFRARWRRSGLLGRRIMKWRVIGGRCVSDRVKAHQASPSVCVTANQCSGKRGDEVTKRTPCKLYRNTYKASRLLTNEKCQLMQTKKRDIKAHHARYRKILLTNGIGKNAPPHSHSVNPYP